MPVDRRHNDRELENPNDRIACNEPSSIPDGEATMAIMLQATRQLINRFLAATRLKRFGGSSEYWTRRYSKGGDSGPGSYGPFASFKAETINEFVSRKSIQSIIEFGCGDGNQLTLAKYHQYLGLDISEKAIGMCCERFQADATKRFQLLSEYNGEKADATMSLDVIYHLVEDDVFSRYMNDLFAAASRFVIIYASNTEELSAYNSLHVRHRRFSDWIDKNQPEWALAETVPNRYPYQGDHRTGSFADFYFFERQGFGS